ncbi:MAG: TetR/AcrR family transcriptional regulator [Microcella sp.]|uniref:TetR/AcrR family transcriptional regulator n=1 Tax=Microcella sp. TaxID=1913979 RepID=UPI003314B612
MAERKTSDERRDEILRATLRLVATKGFASVTLRDVAAEVGVVHGLIRHYYASRDELVAAAFDDAVTRELESDRAQLEGLAPLAALAGWFSATPAHHYLVWIDAWSEAPRTPALAAALDRHHRHCEQILIDLILRVVDAGQGSSIDPAADARMLTALADGVAVQHHAMGIIGVDEADTIVLGAAEQRLGLAPGSLARAHPAPARGHWAEV